MTTGEHFDALLLRFDEEPRKRSRVEAPWASTRPFVQLEFAWGFAQLGLAERARTLADRARAALEGRGRVEQTLCTGYCARVESALARVPALHPGGNGWFQALEALVPPERYAVDRLREVSFALEPRPTDATVRFFLSNNQAPTGDMAAATDEALAREVTREVRALARVMTSEEKRSRVISGLLATLPRLPRAVAEPLLEELLALNAAHALERQAAPLEAALWAAAHFGFVAQAERMVAGLAALPAPREDIPAAHQLPADHVFASMLGSLRRLGMTEAALVALQRAPPNPGADARALCARLVLAQGYASLGLEAKAGAALDEALRELAAERLATQERVWVLQRVAPIAPWLAPKRAAQVRAAVEAQLPHLTDNLSTNRYFCRSLVGFADALVLAHLPPLA